MRLILPGPRPETAKNEAGDKGHSERNKIELPADHELRLLLERQTPPPWLRNMGSIEKHMNHPVHVEPTSLRSRKIG
jgi:hypothetical protein